MRATGTSLGDMLQRAGVVDAALLEACVGALRDRLRSGNPTSLGRLLIERGIPSTRILAVATSGERLGTIRCDACRTVQALPSPPPVREFPCARCGAYLLPLGPASDGSGGSTIIDDAVMPLPAPMTPALPNPEPNEDTTMPLGNSSPLALLRRTGRFDGILPIPEANDGSSGSTHAFNKVLPLPGSARPGVKPAARPPSAPAVPFVQVDLSGSEDVTAVGIPAVSTPPPTSGVGVPPQINARPGFAAPPAYAPPASMPPLIHQGIPPVIQDPRVASSSVRPRPPAPQFGLDSEAPTVADPEGSAGAFGDAAAAAVAATATPARTSTVEQKSPIAGSREQRLRSSRQQKRSPGIGKGVAIFLGFAAVLFVFAVAALVYVLIKYLH